MSTKAMLNGVVIVGALATLGLTLAQWQRNAILREELAGLKLVRKDEAISREEHARWEGKQLSPEARSEWERSRTEAGKLRREIDELKAKLEKKMTP